MSNNSKIFRLFISSTFKDFQLERETLQTKVFPEIKEYCSSKGYTFQPIDLRWGVSAEAQIDQKALEMCIKEVQSCKKHSYPNFLIMLGDRYGWVPLPNIIEASEFELILKNVKVEDKELLLYWYYEDKNQLPPSFILKQLPPSFILKQGTRKYIDDYKWAAAESNLRRILQNAIENLDDTLRAKFITSATESEAIEGIVSYFKKTEYQKQLLHLIPELEQLDHKHIFGFFRDIDTNSIIEDQFVSDDYYKAQEFKDKVKKQLVSENILHVTTSQVLKDKLDEKYLDEFTESILNFLKLQVDQQIKKDEEKDYTSLELEKQQQHNYLNQKLENFLGQQKALEEIRDYISNEDDKPLIICGESGIGKSSIMAKTIEDTSNTFSKKIIYRFIGATPNSTTTKDLLTSILEELNITLEDEKLDTIENQFLTDIDKEENSFVELSNKVYEEIMNITDDIVIFVDAVDQLYNDDQFLWLPSQLPSNIKIVISVLKDRNYKEDSKYFYTLEDKISKFIEIEPFNKPIELLELLLLQQNRTLQDAQKEYFLKQYNKVNTPLYVYIAANQMLYWTSHDLVDTNVSLSFTQKDIVKKFIENLTSLHHHDRRLVKKVFGYILASKDGLSEYEILELLNTNKKFVKTIAPDTRHTNTTQELPLVIWTRLYGHIKPFLSRKKQDGQELLYFFHREFIDIIENQPNQQKEHKNIIEATQKLIKKNQDKEFNSNRWGKLYANLLVEYFLKYDKNDIIKKFCKILNNINNDFWLISFIEFFQQMGWRLNTLNKFNEALGHRKLINLILENLYNKSSKWLYLYTQSSHNVASTLYRLNQTIEAIEIEEKNINIIENISDYDSLNSIEFMKYLNHHSLKEAKNSVDIKGIASLMWTDSYLKILSVLSSCYSKRNQLDKAIELDKKSCNIAEIFYNAPNNNGKFFIKHYLTALNNLSESHYKNNEINDAISLQKKALNIVEQEHDLYSGYLVEDYARILNNLSIYLEYIDPIMSKQFSEKSYALINKLHNLNPQRYLGQLHNINSNKTSIDINNGYLDNYEQYFSDSVKILDSLESIDKENWIEEQSNKLLIKSYEYYKKNDLEQSLKYLKLNKRIIEYVYIEDKKYWAQFYIQQLISLSKVLNDTNQYQEAMLLLKESINICEQCITENDEWYDLYTKNMNNLANTYTYLNQKEEAYELNKKNLSISTKLFQKDQQKWFRAYYWALENMASTYFYNGDDKKEKECKDKIKELESNPLFKFEKDVIENKSDDKKIKYLDYFYKALLLLGIYFFIKYVFLE
ncbi:MAG: DUF4062 domain-containing protein [Sulfurospirillaceae bacterium]|nr:DUF4062 domain-containing protein [Sulfurospirillaceae bacterium]MDD2827439.1 DUF4062 domain-containing protein [Sulfurospirillaceae bacterium]